jgi:hypothetical protein
LNFLLSSFVRRKTKVQFVVSSEWRVKTSAERGLTVIMLTSSANQYLRPEYLTPLPTTVSSLMTKLKISLSNALDKCYVKICFGALVILQMFWILACGNMLRLRNSQ